MNPHLRKAALRNWVRRAGLRRLACILLTLCLLGGGVLGLAGGRAVSAPELTVHEWGTFTAVAGNDGEAVEWTPWQGSSDLPGFVEHLRDPEFKQGLRGTVRMETPVLYFHSPHDMTVSVKVAFSKGLITEWYPRASRVRPTGKIRNAELNQLPADGSIQWSGVRVTPNEAGEFPHEPQDSHYYSARDTAAAPVHVKTSKGEQQERFLFYRGASAMRLPLSARLDSEGRLVVRNLGEEEVPAVILFERRGESVGYRMAGALADQTTLDPPVSNGPVDALCGDLEGILVNRGLYPDEAHAMVETWRHSWFEEGSRLIYIVPTGFLNHVLPLSIDPLPGETVRVFVGRLEIVSPATVQAVKTAIVSDNEAGVARYARFLEPILQTIRETDPGWDGEKH
jgi:hypothetical protein